MSRQKIQELNAKLKAVQRESDKKFDALNRAYKKLSSSMDEIIADRDGLEAKCYALVAEKEALTKSLKTKGKTSNSLKREIKAVTNRSAEELARADLAYKRRTNALTVVQALVASLRQELVEARAENKKLSADFEAFKVSADQDMVSLSEELVRATRLLEVKKTEVKVALADVHRYQDEANQTRRDLAILSKGFVREREIGMKRHRPIAQCPVDEFSAPPGEGDIALALFCDPVKLADDLAALDASLGIGSEIPELTLPIEY